MKCKILRYSLINDLLCFLEKVVMPLNEYKWMERGRPWWSLVATETCLSFNSDVIWHQLNVSSEPHDSCVVTAMVLSSVWFLIGFWCSFIPAWGQGGGRSGTSWTAILSPTHRVSYKLQLLSADRRKNFGQSS